MDNAKPNHDFCLDLQQTELALQAIQTARTIAIISHRNPDPDTVGSNLTVHEMLVKLGKNVHSFCLDNLPQSVKFLPNSESYRQEFDPQQYDLIISVDCGSTSQTAYDKIFPDLFTKNFLNIDHHSSNDLFGTINLVNPKKSSTCEIIYHLLKFWHFPISKTMATCLLAGLYYDTGSFMHPNTTAEVLEMAEDLYSLGANQSSVIRHLYKNFTLSKFHLWGETISQAKFTERNSVVAVVTPETYQKHQANPEELNGVISYLSMVKDNDYAVLVNQEKPGQIKGSLRTNHNHINVSEMAAELGGGGHKKASGFGFQGKLSKETVWKVVNS